MIADGGIVSMGHGQMKVAVTETRKAAQRGQRKGAAGLPVERKGRAPWQMHVVMTPPWGEVGDAVRGASAFMKSRPVHMRINHIKLAEHTVKPHFVGIAMYTGAAGLQKVV